MPLDTPGKYPCEICGDKVPPFETPRKLLGHLGSPRRHKMKARDYVELYPDTEDWFKPEAKETSPEPFSPALPDNVGPTQTSLLSPTDQILAFFSEQERVEYDAFYENIFQQVDRDTAQVPLIQSLVMDTIMLSRLRLKQIQLKGKYSEDTVEEIEKTSKRIDTAMKALGISRLAKLANKVQVRSSVGSLIAGYFDEIERKTKEELLTMETEENKILAVSTERMKTWILSAAPDLTADQKDDENALLPDVEEIIRRAGISL